jgi:hypothetical protein
MKKKISICAGSLRILINPNVKEAQKEWNKLCDNIERSLE